MSFGMSFQYGGYIISVTSLGMRHIITDGGGPGTISQLRMVEVLMRRVEFDLKKNEGQIFPADYIQFMGGVGFGG